MPQSSLCAKMISLLSIGKPLLFKNKKYFKKIYIFLINKNLPRVGACVHRWNVSQYI